MSLVRGLPANDVGLGVYVAVLAGCGSLIAIDCAFRAAALLFFSDDEATPRRADPSLDTVGPFFDMPESAGCGVNATGRLSRIAALSWMIKRPPAAAVGGVAT